MARLDSSWPATQPDAGPITGAVGTVAGRPARQSSQRTYSAGQWPPPARGMEFMMLYCGFLGRAPFGRNEGDQPMMWVRCHDEYDS
jgi:Bacterial protein of unknown function (DUF899)